MAVQIQIRRDTAAAWTAANPTLAHGELGLETDTTRAKVGDGATAWNDLPYWPALGTGLEFEPQFEDRASLVNMSPAQFPVLFPTHWSTWPRRNSNWNEYLGYLFWAFHCPESGNSLAATKYASWADMATALQTIVPMAGGLFQGHVLFWTYDAVDAQDPYPMERHCRNSLQATIMGRNHWLRRHQAQRYGVSGEFNAPAYYMNFYNRLGIELVTEFNGQVPPTNDDGVVWFSGAKRGGLWNYPKVGEHVILPGAGGPHRAAVWNTNTQVWEAPVGGGPFEIREPFYLHGLHDQRQRNLHPAARRGRGRPSARVRRLAGVSAHARWLRLLDHRPSRCWLRAHRPRASPRREQRPDTRADSTHR